MQFIQKIINFFSKKEGIKQHSYEIDPEMAPSLYSSFKQKVVRDKKRFEHIKRIYDPTKDREGSDIHRFMKKRVIDGESISMKQLNDYEKRYQIQLPELLKQVLSEIGHGDFSSFILSFDANKNLNPPVVCLEEKLAIECFKGGADLNDIGFELSHGIYDFENNQFNHKIIQKAYEELNSNREKLLTFLFPVSRENHEFLIVNKHNDEKLVSFSTEYGVEDISLNIEGKVIDIPYYKHWRNSLTQKLEEGIKSNYWEFWESEIERLNQQKKEFNIEWLKPFDGQYRETLNYGFQLKSEIRFRFEQISFDRKGYSREFALQKLDFNVNSVFELQGKVYDYSEEPIKTYVSFFDKRNELSIKSIEFGILKEGNIHAKILTDIDFESVNTGFKRVNDLTLEVDLNVSLEVFSYDLRIPKIGIEGMLNHLSQHRNLEDYLEAKPNFAGINLVLKTHT